LAAAVAFAGVSLAEAAGGFLADAAAGLAAGATGLATAGFFAAAAGFGATLADGLLRGAGISAGVLDSAMCGTSESSPPSRSAKATSEHVMS
jgi:uncharacterized RDD family membrane protein YckC